MAPNSRRTLSAGDFDDELPADELPPYDGDHPPAYDFTDANAARVEEANQFAAGTMQAALQARLGPAVPAVVAELQNNPPVRDTAGNLIWPPPNTDYIPGIGGLQRRNAVRVPPTRYVRAKTPPPGREPSTSPASRPRTPPRRPKSPKSPKSPKTPPGRPKTPPSGLQRRGAVRKPTNPVKRGTKARGAQKLVHERIADRLKSAEEDAREARARGEEVEEDKGSIWFQDGIRRSKRSMGSRSRSSSRAR